MVDQSNARCILGLIPARGGSKGIPRKNIKTIAGKPLIAWAIEAALQAPSLSGVVVTTDDVEIAEVALEYGAQVPFLRPADLARDDTPGVEPVIHALKQLPQYDSVLLLQPTSPLRRSTHIEACLAQARCTSASCIVSVSPTLQHPYWMYHVDERQRLRSLFDLPQVTRRQDLPPVYAANGAMYFADAAWLHRQRTFITPETAAFVMASENAVDLDTPFDWKLAEFLLLEMLS